MKKALFRICLLMAATLILPGCLAINAALGVIGFLGTGPIQYAGTAYSIAEYSYEFAINDKTPDEVITEKLAWLLPDEEKEENPIVTAHVESLRNSPTTAPDPPFRPAAQLVKAPAAAQSTVATAADMLTPTAAASVQVASATPVVNRITLPESRKQRRTRNNTTPTPILAEAAPTHQYVDRPSDPLLERISRLEQLLPQAEMIVAQRTTEGVRYGVSTGDAEQSDLGVSGSWSIRHRLN